MFVGNIWERQSNSASDSQINLANYLNYLPSVSVGLLATIGVFTVALRPLDAAEVTSEDRSAAILTVSLPTSRAAFPGELKHTLPVGPTAAPQLIAQNVDGGEVPDQIVVKDFEVVGSSVFSPQEPRT